MKKRILFLLLIAFVVVAVAACGSERAQPTATTVPTLAITAEPTAAASAEEPAWAGDLTPYPWLWTSFTGPEGQFDVEMPESYLLAFNGDGTLNIVADCNNAMGSYAEDAGSLSIEVGPMTMAMCLPESRSDQFVGYLGAAARYFFEDGMLYIDLFADGGTMAFAPADPELMGDDGEGAMAGALPRFEPLEECFVLPPEDLGFEWDYNIDCGYVVVPETRDGENTREVKLGVTRIHSRAGTDAAPLFKLAGGPGATQVSELFYFLLRPDMLGGILESRDMVVIEQRGTQYTDTWLDCPEVSAAPWTAYEQGLTGDEAKALTYEAMQGCIDGFRAQGINLDAYNSVENAADVNDVRVALGYDQIIYYGASYGSQLGQHVMRDFPEILEGVVLDGANALSRKSWVEDRALDAQWGIDNLTALCEADEKCIAAYDIPALVDDALALFDDGPLPYTYTDPADPSVTVEGEVTVHDMVSFINGQQGDRYGAFSLPGTLSLLIQGGAEATAEFFGPRLGANLLAARDPSPGSFALIMHLAMVCSDDPVHSVDDVILDGLGAYATLFGQSAAEDYTQDCSLINVQELPDSTDVDVTTDVPVLLLSGDLDVATPTFRSKVVADQLPNATLVVFPGQTHVQIGAGNYCAGEIMTQFVLDPTATLDLSCTEENPVLGFVLPDGTMSKQAEE